MLSLLLIVLILGVIAWVVQSSPIPEFFKVVAYAILAIILLVRLFAIIGVSVPSLG
jgi:hypothetical protein